MSPTCRDAHEMRCGNLFPIDIDNDPRFSLVRINFGIFVVSERTAQQSSSLKLRVREVHKSLSHPLFGLFLGISSKFL